MAQSVDWYGGSLIHGLRADGEIAQPNLCTDLYNRYGYVVFNRGVDGNDTTKILAGTGGNIGSFSSMVQSSASATALLTFTINDYNLSDSEFTANINQMVSILKARTAIKNIIFVTGQPTHQDFSGGSAASDAYVENRWNLFKQLATANGVQCIDCHAYLLQYMQANDISTAEFTPDGLHPTQSGYDLMAAYISPRIKDIVEPPAPAPGPSPSPGGGGTTPAPTPAPSLISIYDTITIIKAPDGGLVYQAFLTNETHIVSADKDGVVDSLADAGTHVVIYRGSQDVTKQFTFVVVPKTGADVLTFDQKENSIRVTSLTSDTATLLITCWLKDQPFGEPAGGILEFNLMKSKRTTL